MHSLQCKGFAGTSLWTVEVHPLLTPWPTVAVYLLKQASLLVTSSRWPVLDLCCFSMQSLAILGQKGQIWLYSVLALGFALPATI